ncbi:MAG: glycosyltransferase, partial [Actinobacteria bacterium]
MHVLMIEHYTPESPYADKLARGLAAHAVELNLLSKRGSPPRPASGISVKPVFPSHGAGSRASKLFEYCVAYMLLVWKLALGHHDLVHVQSMRLPAVEWLPYAAFSWRRPIVVTVHNVLPHEETRLGRMAYGSLYRHACLLICHTQSTIASLSSTFGEWLPPIALIPHPGYDDIQPANGDKTAYRNKLSISGDPVLLFFGLLRRYKALDFMLEVLRGLLPRLPNVTLVVAGKAPDKALVREYKALADRLGVGGAVRFDIRHISDRELETYFGASDAVVLPYDKIDQSGVLLLACSFGRPVFASDVGGLGDVVLPGKTGALFR